MFSEMAHTIEESIDLNSLKLQQVGAEISENQKLHQAGAEIRNMWKYDINIINPLHYIIWLRTWYNAADFIVDYFKAQVKFLIAHRFHQESLRW